MKKERKIPAVFLVTLLTTTLLTSFMPKATTTTFFINQKSEPTCYVFADPDWVQEGLNTSIIVGLYGGEANKTYTLTVNVTDPVNDSYTKVLTIATNASGSGENTTIYYGDFLPEAHTNLTGTYLITVNETLAIGNFTVGLTDKLEYHATEIVRIRGSGYLPDEQVCVNITFGADAILSEDETAFNGVVEANWTIPTDAKPGTYTVTLTNTTAPGTVKEPPDVQNFTVIVVKIDSIEPNAGPVGTLVRLIGEIIEPNGNYTILWDNKSLKKGLCAPRSRVVNDTFIVPPSFKGNHTVTLCDIIHNVNSTAVSFSVNETTYRVFAEPDWIQEGLYTNITISLYGGETNKSYFFTINVTDPAGMSSTANLIVSSNETGSGIGSKKYWDEFAGGNITKFVGVYSIRVNETDLNLTGEFTVGLTDKPKYRRDEVVSVRGSSYQPNENVTIDITFGGLSVSGYPKNVTADTGGVVNDTWLIPTIAEPGTYTVTLTNATTPGTVKDPADTKNFTITGFIVQIETRNLDNETVAGLTVYAWNATKPTTLEEMPPVASGRTNETGWVRFPLEAGNYTFWALWRHENTEEGQEAMVGSLDNQSVMEDRVLTLPCRLAHIKIAVKDEADIPLPLVDVTLACNYTAWFGTSFEPPPISRETNLDGVTTVSNMPTNISYTIEARRFNNPFNRTLIENLTASLWVNITCPTYTLFIHVIDANENPAQNVRVNVSEWSTWLPQGSKTTDQSGSVDFFITFGKYKVSVSNYSVELKRVVVINETIIDLTEEKQWMLIYCKLLNLDLTVKVVDYFGHPIPNALVKIKRENVEMKDLTTGSSGTATLEGIIGGEYQVSVYIRGKLCGTMSQSVDASKEMVCKIDGCVVIGGYPMETSQFITLVLLSLLVGAFGLTLLRRKLPRMMKKEKTPSKKGG